MKKLMTSLCLAALSLTAAAQYQLQNGSFEEWDNEGSTSIEPKHWNSFMTGEGNFKSLAAGQQVKKSNEVRPGTSGSSSVHIYARSVWGVVAQGNLTTGRINMGSTNATDANGNYNFTQADNADFHQKITGCPDALRLWAKVSCHYGAAASATLHTEGYFQDPVGNNITAQVVAKANNSEINSNDDWEEIIIPFEYKLTDGTRPAYALVTLNTSGSPGKGKEQDYMLVDDLDFIYYSELESATFNGKNIDFTDGKATVSGEYDAQKLQLQSNGQAATIETSYDADAKTLTITVKGDDISINPTNKHVYTITFDAGAEPIVDVTGSTLPNGGFEEWKETSGSSLQVGKGMLQRPGTEPADWNGSSINQKVSLISVTKELISQTEDEQGGKAVRMTNTFVGIMGMGSNAPAYITLGTPWVYTTTSPSDCDGGTYGGVEYNRQPDALRGRFRRTTGSEGEENAHIIAYLWRGTFSSKIGKAGAPTTDAGDVERAILGKSESTGDGQLIASCDYAFTSTENDGWQTITVPLRYEENTNNLAPEKMNVIISSGDYWNRSNIHAGNMLDADNVEWLFYSELASATYNGKNIDFIDGKATIDEEYDADKLSYTLMGRASTAKAEFDEDACMQTITVSGGDVDVNTDNVHTYSIQFRVPQPYNPVLSEKEYTDLLQVTINEYANEPQQATVTLQNIDDGTSTFILRNFTMGNGNDKMYVGTIIIDGLQIDSNGKFNCNRNINIAAGDTPANERWLGPILGEVPIVMDGELRNDSLLAHIQIDLTKKMGQAIDVKFGKSLIDQENKEPDPDPDPDPDPTLPVLKLEGTHTYNDALVVTLNGNSMPAQQKDITIVFHPNNTLDLALRNFIQPNGEDVMYVGNVEIFGVPYKTKAGQPYATFSRSENVNIAAGTEPADAFWMGPLLGEIPVNLQGKVGTDKLNCTIDIELGGVGTIHVDFGNDENWPELTPEEPKENTILRNCTFTDKLLVSVNGVSSLPQDAEVILEVNNDETIDLTLKNFWLIISDEEKAPIGNIHMANIQVTESADKDCYTFMTQQDITIEDGDPIQGVMWTGPYFGEIPVMMSGKLARWKLYLNISIYMPNQNKNINVTFGDYFTDTINEIMKSRPASGSIYTINGQRIQQVSKPGIYIINGKKVIKP